MIVKPRRRKAPQTRLVRLLPFRRVSWLLVGIGLLSLFSCTALPAIREGDASLHTASAALPEATRPASTGTAPPQGAGEVRAGTASPSPTATAADTVRSGAGTPGSAASPTPIGPGAPGAIEAVPVYGYRIVNVYPHDPEAFTQGLVFHDGILYEGTGLWGESTLRKVDLESGEILKLYSLPPQYFGEGITIYGDRVIQLTWREETGFVYDKDSFEWLETFTYTTEGWGLTHDGTRLIMSDGTATLYFWDPETFEETGRVQVYDDDGPVVRVNELEYIQGLVYANVWLTDLVAIIDPQSGRVTAYIDLGGLLEAEDRGERVDVLNGIAYDPAGDRLFVTGKLWPKLFEIELIPPGRVLIPLVGR
jgi:glutamine cyclotransferase